MFNRRAFPPTPPMGRGFFPRHPLRQRKNKMFQMYSPRNQTRGSQGLFFHQPRSSGSESVLKSIMNPEGINQLLTTTQKVLNTTQQIGSMVQQYGPIVRNLPAMWKIYKSLKDTDESESIESENDKEKETKVEENSNETSPSHQNPQTFHGMSRPKLYI